MSHPHPDQTKQGCIFLPTACCINTSATLLCLPPPPGCSISVSSAEKLARSSKVNVECVSSGSVQMERTCPAGRGQPLPSSSQMFPGKNVVPDIESLSIFLEKNWKSRFSFAVSCPLKCLQLIEFLRSLPGVNSSPCLSALQSPHPSAQPHAHWRTHASGWHMDTTMCTRDC